MADDRPESRERIAFFPYTPVSDRIRTFVALLFHAGQPAGIRIPVQRISCFQTNDLDKTSPAFPAGKRVLPFFLFSSGSPIPGCRILKDKKIIVNRPVRQIFHPSRKNPVSPPENACRQILRITAPFLFRWLPFSAVFPLKTRRFRRTTNRFLSPETPVWPVLAEKANAFSMSIGPPFKSRRPALCFFPESGHPSGS